MESMQCEKIKSIGIEEEYQEKPFSRTGGDAGADILDWCLKLEALGNIVAAIAWHERKFDAGTEVLTNDGEMLGSIISDYSSAVRITLENDIQKKLKNPEKIFNPLPECQRAIDHLNHIGSFTPSDLRLIETEIGKLQEFSEAVSVPAMRMHSELSKWHEKVQQALNKKASAN